MANDAEAKLRISAENRTREAFDEVRRSIVSVDESARKLGDVFKSLLILEGAREFTRELVRAGVEGEQSANRLTATLRATGHQVGLTRHELDELAESLSASTTFDDDGIRNAEAQLIKFGNIHGQVFRGALKVSADLAAFMGTDVAEAAQLVGKALQSPTEGITALERQFGKLTQAQKDNISSLAEQGKAIETQNAILDILRERVGGVAEQMNTGLTKATHDVSKAWDDMLKAWARTPAVGGLAAKGIEAVAEALKLLTPREHGPLDQFKQDLLGVESELRRIEASRPEKGRSRLVDDRIAELRQQREALRALLDAATAKNLDPFAFDESSLNVELGGKVKEAIDADAKRRAEEAAKGAQAILTAMNEPLVQAAQATEQTVDDIVVTWNSLGDRLEIPKAKFDEFIAAQEKAAQNISDAENQPLVQQAQAIQDLGDSLVYTYDKAGNAITLTREQFDKLNREQEKGIDVARELGLTFTSAFENAIVEGEKLQQVLLGIEKDVLRIFVRKTITEPAANDLIKIFKEMGFGGGGNEEPTQLGGPRAGGGPVTAGTGYLVGERGPELFVPGTSGNIVSNGALGSITINSNVTVGDGVSLAEVRQAIAVSQKQTVATVREALRR